MNKYSIVDEYALTLTLMLRETN